MIISGGAAVGFAPQALGEVTPIANATGYFYGRDALELSGQWATYSRMYQAQPTVATVVDKVSNAVARLSLHVWDASPAAGKVLDATSPYARLIANPCQGMSPYAFYRWTAATYEIFGEAFWYKVRGGLGQVLGLLPMHPSRVAVERDKDGKVVYVFTLGVASAGLLRAPAADVVPFLRYHPDNLMRGLSRLEPLRSTLLNEDAARRATASWWKRGARPSFALSTDQKLSEPAVRRLQATIQADHAGADNMGGSLVLEEGLKPIVTQLTAEDMQYVETRKLNMQETCMVYDIPPPVVHILDHATFSNITEQMRSMYRDSMAPRLEDLESVVDTFLRPDFDADGVKRAKFALDEVLRGDFETRATAIQQLVQSGVMKPSEARPLFDLDDAGPRADKLYANAALQPLGDPNRRVSITETAAGDAADNATAQQTIDQAHAAENATEQPNGASAPLPTPKPPAKGIDADRTLMGLRGRVAQRVAELEAQQATEEESP